MYVLRQVPANISAPTDYVIVSQLTCSLTAALLHPFAQHYSARCLVNLAGVYKGQERYEEAASMFAEAIEIMRIALPKVRL